MNKALVLVCIGKNMTGQGCLGDCSVNDFQNKFDVRLKGIILGIFTQALCKSQDGIQGRFFKQGKFYLNSEFSFSLTGCLITAKELNLSYYFPMAAGRTDGLMSFPRTLALSGILTAKSRI